jgi:hypothetical protein
MMVGGEGAEGGGQVKKASLSRRALVGAATGFVNLPFSQGKIMNKSQITHSYGTGHDYYHKAN